MRKAVDRGVYLNTINQLKYLAVLMIFIGAILVFANQPLVHNDLYNLAGKSASYNIANGSQMAIMFIGSIVLSLYAIGFTWSRKRADFEYSVPVTKGKMYISKVYAVLSLQVSVLLITFLLAVINTAEYIGLSVFFSDMFLSFINAVIGSAIIVGAVFVSASVTGRPLSAVVLAGGIIFLPIVFSTFGLSVFQSGVAWTNDNMVFKSSYYVLLNLLMYTTRLSIYTRYVPGIIFSIVLGAGYLTAGYFLFKKRSGELTGNHTKNKLVHYLVMATVPSCIIFAAVNKFFEYQLFLNEIAATLITLLTAALVMLFSYDVWVYKKFRRKNRCIWIFLALVILISSVFFGRIHIWKMQYEKILDAQEIESINIETGSKGFSLTYMDNEVSYGEFIASSCEITYREIIDELVKYHNKRFEPRSADSYTKQENEKTETHTLMIKINYKKGKSEFKYMPIYFIYDVEKNILKENVYTRIKAAEEYAEKFYACIPIEYVTHVSYCDDFLVEESYEKMKEVYKIFYEEYNELPYDKRHEMAKANILPINSYWQGITWQYDETEKLYIKGRVGSFDTLDIYYLTDLTPKALEAYREVIQEIVNEDLEAGK